MDEAPGAQTGVDSAAPVIYEVNGISDGDVIKSATVLGATARDNTGVASFKLLINDETVVDEAKASIVYHWNVGQAEPGAYTLKFMAADAAGNTVTLDLSVEVAEAEAGDESELYQTELVATTAQLDAYGLPEMDPNLYNPNDAEAPSLIISGIANESVAYGVINVSACASDDTGVNVIALLIDGTQVAVREAAGINYIFDTNLWENGYHLLTFLLRDNGRKVGRCELHITVDNKGDYYGPEIDTATGSTWEIHGLTGDVTPVVYDTWTHLDGAGLFHVHITASDPAGVKKIEVLSEDKSEVVASALGDTLDFDWQSDLTQNFNCLDGWVMAEDELGNKTWPSKFSLYAHNNTDLSGYIRGANGAIIDGLTVSIRLGQYDTVEEAAEAPVLTRPTSSGGDWPLSIQTDGNGWFEFADRFPDGTYFNCGNHTLFVENTETGLQAMFPLELKPRGKYDYEPNEAFVIPATGGNPEPNRRLALMTGNADDALVAIGVLANTECRYFYDEEAGIPEAIDLVDGDGSLNGDEPEFLDFITDPELLYQYRYIVIESGNIYEGEWAQDAGAVATLKTWVADGGQLYLTNHSYDFMEQLFPEYVDFAGDDGIDGLGAVPEALNAAQLGGETEFVFISHMNYFWDNRFADYWQSFSPIITEMEVEDNHLVMPDDGWPPIETLADSVHVYIDGMVAPEEAKDYVDLGVGVHYGQGRVIFNPFTFTSADYDTKMTNALFFDLAMFSH
ncbi:hypothetical protein JW859_05700 [bacterium]|nr:hypothetical protein [bacterium]